MLVQGDVAILYKWMENGVTLSPEGMCDTSIKQNRTCKIIQWAVGWLTQRGATAETRKDKKSTTSTVLDRLLPGRGCCGKPSDTVPGALKRSCRGEKFDATETY